ncbi:MAG: group 1 glycosyl transferase [uncultured bacterium]|nr:MAG: group 1 glycosyl transferase [uncultured bacterium]
MVIGINGYEAVVSRFGYNSKTKLPNRVGSSAYCFELLINLNKLDKENEYLIYVPHKPTSDLPSESENWKYKIIPNRKFWTITSLGPHFLLNRKKLDVFFSPTHYLPPFGPGNSVISVLDVSYLYFPELFTKKDLIQLKEWTKFSVKKAKKILTISESSKSDMIKEYKVSANKVVVVYPGINVQLNASSYLNMEDLKNKFGINSKYILFVGTLQPRKNIIKLIEAFSKLDKDLELVIVGRKGWQYEEILSAPGKYGVKDKVRFLDSVTNEDLPSLYKSAEFFILPSLYEGFGLPVLEAMSYGCPVITSNVSSLPEAGGDGALYVDPEDANDIASKMKKLLEDDELREDLIKKGYNQVKKFSWEKSARETLKILEEVGNA